MNINNKIKPNPGYVCIVDAYSTGAELARELFNLGFKLIHVKSSEVIAKSYASSFQSNLFEQLLVFKQENLPAIINTLSLYNLQLVIAGSEPGVILADTIAALLKLSTNDPNTSLLRRNKYQMNEAIRLAGLSSTKQALVESLNEALAIVDSWTTWPIVVKPVDSAGGEDVRFCYTETDLTNAFDNIFMKKNFMGDINNKVLIQERLYGKQYVVNAVSIDGKHKITEIWQEDKIEVKGGGNIYDKEIMLPYHGTIQQKLITYTKKVLDTLDVKEGPSHNEIIVTKDGPVLLEIGARLQGGIVSKAIIEAIGDSHVTMTIKKFLNPDEFIKSIDIPYEIRKNIMVVNLISGISGVVLENHCEELLSTLPSFYLIVRTPKIGDHVLKTVDLLTKVGHIYLLHEDESQLYNDYKQIREWEGNGSLLVLYQT